MLTVHQRVSGFGDALISVAGSTAVRENVENWMGGMLRKSATVATHVRLLEQVRWRELPDLGREVDAGLLSTMQVSLDGATLTLSSYRAAMDWVYMAVDGAVAGMVNVTDTMARAINEVYGLGVDARGASLRAVGNAMSPTCPVAVILTDPSAMSWWEKARSLRGECQHGRLETVLDAGGPVSRVEPKVHADYIYAATRGPELLTYLRGLHDDISQLCVHVMTEVETDPAASVAPR